LGDLALRYLAAFGPATVRDLQAWSGLTGLRAVVDSLHPHLRVFRSESGQVLFDLPDAPRPGPDVPAPVRFLAPLDNVVLAYADRSRFMTDEQRRYVGFEAVLMVDGFVRGLWSVRRQADRADLTVKLFDPLGADEPAVREEGEALLRFVAPEVDEHRLEFVPVET
ncbi:MAG TPA: crosslink repair DNA glycosylase YcaQ family protein, partial [Actinopolymorphaceae bacterium]